MHLIFYSGDREIGWAKLIDRHLSYSDDTIRSIMAPRVELVGAVGAIRAMDGWSNGYLTAASG